MSHLAEQNVIGSLLMDMSCMDEIYNLLAPEMFASELLGRIYLEFQRGYDNRYPVNMVVLEQKLQSYIPSHLLLEELGRCAAQTMTSALIKTYADAVAKDYKARRLESILGSVKASPDRIDEQIGQLSEELEALLGNREAKPKTLAEVARENKGRYFAEDAAPKINTGFPKLDGLLGGLEGGDMIVIGARPAIGKSAFVTQIASFLSGQGKRVGFYNLEMQEKQVYERFVVSESGIGLTRLRRATNFLGDEKERFRRANETLEKKDNIVLMTGSRTVSGIRSESRHMGYDVIIIDYLQLLKPDKDYRGNRYAEVGAVSRAIKELAMELDIPVVALSQLNRTSEIKDTKEPTMAELREAGDIEQDASVIMLLWNLSQGDPSKKGCKIEKQRQGRTGKVVLKFNGDLMRFEETKESVKEAQKWKAVADGECPFP